MTDNNEDLKQELKLLKEEIDLLKKQLQENKEGDNHRHKEIKELQERQHQDDMKWKKIGTFTTPITLIGALITWYLNKRSEKSNKEDKLDKVLELLKK